MNSTENRPDPDRDERIDAAWRATNRDEPPAALDELIRAAARREVAAGPIPSRRQPAWMRAMPPLAAAAAVAVIAVGIVQLTPPEQVVPTPTTAARSEYASAPAAAKPTARGDSQAKEESASSDQRRAENPLSKSKPQLDSLAESKQLAQTNVTPPVPASSASMPLTAPPTTPSTSAPAAGGRTPSAAVAAPASPAPSAVPAPLPQALPQARRSEPFPAASPGAGAAPAAKVSSSTLERDEPSQAAGSLSKDLAPPPQAPSRHDAASNAGVAATPEGAARGTTHAQTQAQPAPRYAGGQLASHDEPSERAQRAKTAEVAAAAQSDSLAGQAPARTVDDWVRRLRRLKEQGATEELLKELAAFRGIYGAGANTLLPADLRDIKP